MSCEDLGPLVSEIRAASENIAQGDARMNEQIGSVKSSVGSLVSKVELD